MKLPLSIILIVACFSPLIAQKPEPVKIGYLIQDLTYISARHGAELAVKLANEKGGLNGHPFQIIVKSMEGPWGTGSTQAVDLIFNEKVCALLGTHDGRNGHLVEQAATKTTTVFVSAWPSDPTLSQAFVPWFFNVVPTDLEQATILVDNIYDKMKISRVAVIADNSYDSKQSLKAFLRINDEKRKTKPAVFEFENFKSNPVNLFSQIKRSGASCILIYTSPLNSSLIVKTLREQKSALPVYGSLAVLNEDVLTPSQLQEMYEVIKVPSGLWSKEKKLKFSQTYFKAYGHYPGMAAAYAFDGMNVLIEAIKNCQSTERENIQLAIARLNIQGVTGSLAFDEHGNRRDPGVVCHIQNGLPAAEIK